MNVSLRHAFSDLEVNYLGHDSTTALSFVILSSADPNQKQEIQPCRKIRM